MGQVVGVDGYAKGWIAIVLQEGRVSDALARPSLDLILKGVPNAETIAVDIPIGVVEENDFPRAADHAAKGFLRHRPSSVFLTPLTAVLHLEHKEATAKHAAQVGKGISRQSHALGKKILEVNALMEDPRIIEVHPEVSFHELARQHALPSKKTWNGLEQRRVLLRDAGIDLPVPDERLNGVPADDVLDAAVAAWSADRYRRDLAGHLGSVDDVDTSGRPRVIWY